MPISIPVFVLSPGPSVRGLGWGAQAPFEDITKEQYDEMIKSLKNIDLTQIVELQDDTNLTGELACAGGSCEVS